MATLAPRRLASRIAVYAAIGLVAAVAAGVVTGATAAVSTARETGARSLMASAPADAASIVVTTHLSDSPTAQDAAVRSLVARQLADVPVVVTRTTTAAPLTTTTGSRVLVGSDPAIRAVAHLVTGSWPTNPAPGTVPTAVQADAAGALHLRVGDVLVVPGPPASVTFVVSGTWTADDPTAVRWHGDSAAASGYTGATLGPFIVAESAMTSLPTSIYARWVVAPVVPQLTTLSIARLADAATVDSVSTAITRAGSITDQSTTVTGELAGTAARATRVVRAAAEIAMLPVILVGTVALITLVQLAGLLATTRAGETTTLRARGTSVGQLTRWAVGESSVVVVPAVLVGWVSGSAVSGGWVLGGGGAAPRGPAAVVAVLAVTVTSARAHAAARDPRSHRDPWRVLGTLVVLSTLLAAGLAGWQLRLDDGGPLAGWAAPLALVSVCLVVAALLGPVAALSARRLAALRALAPVLAARQVARKARVFAVVTLVLALAGGGVTLVAALTATAASVDARTSAAAVGSAVRVRLAGLGVVSGDSVPITAAPYAALPGADSAAVVLATTASVGGDPVDVIAIAAGSAPAVMVGGSDVDVRALVGSSSQGRSAVLRASSVTLDVAADPDALGRAGQVVVSAWVRDSQGALAQVALGAAQVADAARAPVRLTGALPAGVGAWSLLAVDADLVGSPGHDLTVSFTGAVPLDPVTLSSIRAHGRSLAAAARATGLPILVTGALAHRRGLVVGSTVTLDVAAGQPIGAVVAGVAVDVPGAASSLAVLADLPTLDATVLAGGGPVLQPAEVWVATSDPAAVSRASSRVSRLPSHVTTTATESVGPVLDPVGRVLWAGAFSSVVTALIALAAVTATLVRSQRRGGAVLRASGMSTGAQMRLRTAELLGVGAFGIVAGALAGVAAAQLCVAELAHAAVPGAATGVTVLGSGATGAPFALLAGGLAVIAGGYAWAVRSTTAGAS